MISRPFNKVPNFWAAVFRAWICGFHSSHFHDRQHGCGQFEVQGKEPVGVFELVLGHRGFDLRVPRHRPLRTAQGRKNSDVNMDLPFSEFCGSKIWIDLDNVGFAELGGATVEDEVLEILVITIMDFFGKVAIVSTVAAWRVTTWKRRFARRTNVATSSWSLVSLLRTIAITTR